MSSQTSSDHWSQSLQSVLDQPPATLPMRMILGGLAFCCAFGAWAWFGQIQEVSQATGQLTPQGKVYKVQPVTQGEIVRILVKPGQTVKAGQLMAELDNRLATAEVERLEQSLVAYRLQLLQKQELQKRIVLEAETRRAIALAQFQSQEAALAQAQSNAATQQAMVVQVQSEQEAYNARLARLQPLLAEGAIAQEHLFEVEEGIREQQRTLIQNQGQLAGSLAETQRLQAELAQRQAEAQQSQLEAQQQFQQVTLEITDLAAKIADTDTLLKAARTQQQNTFLYAPVTGTVSMINIDNVGEVANPGETFAEIVPQQAPLVLSALLPNREAGFVKVGMPVQMKFDAFPYQDYGVVDGKVLSVSPDAKMDERLGAVYQVEISLDQTNLDHQHQPIHFKAGQTATAEIVVRQHRIMDVLLKPVQALQRDHLNL